MNKYRNRKIIRDGEVFDSVKEWRRYCELLQLEKAGAITELQRQVRILLIPAQYEEFERYSEKNGERLKNGRKCVERAVYYVADFVYKRNGEIVVEDTKGVKTQEYILKRKMMLYFHGIKIKEV